jgi:hypothetical protein
MVVVVLIIGQLMVIFVVVLHHIRAFIVMSMTSHALIINVVVEKEKFFRCASLLQKIWLLITFACVTTGTATHSVSVSPQIIVILMNYLIQVVKERLVLVQYHLPIKDFIFVHGYRRECSLNHAPYIMCGMALRKNVFLKIINFKRCFVLIM